MAEIKAPEYWGPGSPYKNWPYGARAKKQLQDLVANAELTFYCSKNKKNAVGDTVAHIALADGSWLQHLLLQGGHAYFMPRFHRPKMAEALRTAEARARSKRRGLWSLQSLSVVSAQGDKLRTGWFQIIKGRVLSEKRLKGRTFLNFGEDWSRDFTIEIPKRLYRHFSAADTNSLNLEGQTIEVRGWTEWAGGPKIILEFAEQLVVLDENRLN